MLEVEDSHPIQALEAYAVRNDAGKDTRQLESGEEMSGTATQERRAT